MAYICHAYRSCCRIQLVHETLVPGVDGKLQSVLDHLLHRLFSSAILGKLEIQDALELFGRVVFNQVRAATFTNRWSAVATLGAWIVLIGRIDKFTHLGNGPIEELWQERSER